MDSWKFLQGDNDAELIAFPLFYQWLLNAIMPCENQKGVIGYKSGQDTIIDGLGGVRFGLERKEYCGGRGQWEVRAGANSLYLQGMRKHSIPNFIKKAWDMLEQEENWSVIAWNQEGTSFVIEDEARFASALLPHYFKHSNIASFIRQLNMYNFHKRKTASGRTEFYHKLFRKNHRELLIGIKRKPSEAEINEAEELIKELAPECLEEKSQEAIKPPHVEDTLEQHFLPDFQLCYYPDPSQYVIFTPFMFTNVYPEYQWKQEKPVTNNIIIQGVPPQSDDPAPYPLTF